jgi:hypothetical protein
LGLLRLADARENAAHLAGGRSNYRMKDYSGEVRMKPDDAAFNNW